MTVPFATFSCPRSAILAFGLAGLVAVPTLSTDARGETASSVYESEFATLRLDAQTSEADGTIRGALSIDLEPGWKTYWLDPGESGIPPTITFSGPDGALIPQIEAPLPSRLGEGLAKANGYKSDMAIAFTLEAREGFGSGGAPISADVFLGVCEEICIPVQAALTARPRTAVDTIEAAFDALPGRLDPDRITARIDGDVLVLSVSGSDAVLTDAFVRGPEGWYFGEPPAPDRIGETTSFRVPVDARPKHGAVPALEIVFDDRGKGLSVTVQPE